MARVKTREEPTPVDEANAQAARYIMLKGKIKAETTEADRLKKSLNEFLQENGEEDDLGHLWHDLPAEVDGVLSLKRERRAKQTVDQDKTLEVLQEKGLAQRCYRMEPVLDQAEVLKCLAEGLISQDELDEMFPEKIEWALVMDKG